MEKEKKDLSKDMRILQDHLLCMDSTIAAETGLPLEEVQLLLHELNEIYRDVVEFRRSMKAVAKMENVSPEIREMLLNRCCEGFNRMVGGGTTALDCRIYPVNIPCGTNPAPFTHSEGRYDPATKRFWLSEEELNILMAALEEDDLDNTLPLQGRNDIN